MEARVDRVKSDMSAAQETAFKVMDRHKQEARHEIDRLWARTEHLREITVHKTDFENLERKLENQWDRIDKKMDRILDIAVSNIDHENRLNKLEDLLKERKRG